MENCEGFCVSKLSLNKVLDHKNQPAAYKGILQKGN